MIVRHQDLGRSAAVRFNGVGEIAMTAILPPKPEAFAGKGRVFSHVTVKPGQVFGTHKHDGEFEVFYILKGEGVYNDDGTDVVVGPGDVAVCGDGQAHGIRNEGASDLEFIALILFTTKTM